MLIIGSNLEKLLNVLEKESPVDINSMYTSVLRLKYNEIASSFAPHWESRQALLHVPSLGTLKSQSNILINEDKSLYIISLTDNKDNIIHYLDASHSFYVFDPNYGSMSYADTPSLPDDPSSLIMPGLYFNVKYSETKLMLIANPKAPLFVDYNSVFISSVPIASAETQLTENTPFRTIYKEWS